MKILHVGAASTPHAVNGVNAVVWALSEGLADRGHDVSIAIRDSVPGDYESATSIGVDLLRQSELPDADFDIVHMHSAFVLPQARLARRLSSSDVPYVISPHGAYMRPILERKRFQKAIYGRAIELPRIRRAKAVCAINEGEARDVRAYAGDRVPVLSLPNAVSLAPEIGAVPQLDDVEEIVYLGRPDVQMKGLDRVIRLAEEVPELRFGLYGNGMRSISIPLPSNVFTHAPVHGMDKWSVLKSCRALIQLSRWEVFGVSLIEAGMMGAPLISTSEMYMTPWLSKNARTLIVDDGGHGFDREAVVRHVEAEPSYADRAKVRERVCATYSPAAVSATAEAIYREVLFGDSRPNRP